MSFIAINPLFIKKKIKFNADKTEKISWKLKNAS